MAITTNYKCNEWLDEVDIKRIESLPPAQYKVDGLGDWGVTEGLIYEQFVECNKDFIIPASKLPQLSSIYIGVDFGDNKSAHSFTAIGIEGNYEAVYGLKTKKINAEGTTPAMLEDEFVAFVQEVISMYGPATMAFCEHINIYINGFRAALYKANLAVNVALAYKATIFDRIETTRKLFALGKLKLVQGECLSLEDAFNSALWDTKKPKTRLDNGSVDVDSLDSFEYSWSTFIEAILQNMGIVGRRD